MKNVLSGGRPAGYDKNGKQEVQEVGSGGAERVILDVSGVAGGTGGGPKRGPGRVPAGPGAARWLPGWYQLVSQSCFDWEFM